MKDFLSYLVMPTHVLRIYHSKEMKGSVAGDYNHSAAPSWLTFFEKVIEMIISHISGLGMKQNNRYQSQSTSQQGKGQHAVNRVDYIFIFIESNRRTMGEFAHAWGTNTIDVTPFPRCDFNPGDDLFECSLSYCCWPAQLGGGAAPIRYPADAPNVYSHLWASKKALSMTSKSNKVISILT